MQKINSSAAVCILFLALALSAGAEESRQVLIAEGEYTMGDTYCDDEQGHSDWCNDETPHKVWLDAFRIDKYEVSAGDYDKCVAAGACETVPLHEDRARDFNQPTQPVVFVRHMDAEAYCKWKGGRLPTEAEWERAAQGKQLGGAWFKQLYGSGAPAPVGGREPNSNGLYDMLGNVYEWTADAYGPYDVGTLQRNPKGSLDGKEKVVRGGSWNSPAHYLRTSDRVARSPELRYSDVGFRCVQAP